MTRTALVLGGGGITGIAWELGILKGLADAGVDLTTADLVVGTSAGSVVGAQITSGPTVDELYAEPARAGRPGDRRHAVALHDAPDAAAAAAARQRAQEAVPDRRACR